MRPKRISGWYRQLAVLTAVSVCASGCTIHSWRTVPITEMSLREEGIKSRRIRMWTRSGKVVMEVIALRFPFVDGIVSRSSDGIVAVDVRKVKKADIVKASTEGRPSELRRSIALDEESLRKEVFVSGESDGGDLRPKGVRFFTPTGPVFLKPESMQFPRVFGRVISGKGTVTVDLRQVGAMEVQGVDTVKTVAASLGGAAGLLVGTCLIVLLTKESCPFVYVDSGSGFELVGEAYAGAMFRALQRDDLLPLPAPREGTYRVRLSNEARETQYTDRAELLLVDHGPNVRAVSSFDGRVLLVGPQDGPVAVHDLDGRQVADVAQEDQQPWQTDLTAIVDLPNPRLREGLHVRFASPPPGTDPVLEIVGGNTPWLDLVFGRYLASLGGRLNQFAARWSEPSARDRLLDWRQREGIDLKVEVRRNGYWRQIAVVPTVGPIALRRVAVPLEPLDTSDEVDVRLSGGLGFWRIDALSLSHQRPSPMQVHRLAPALVEGTKGCGAPSSILRTDGEYNVLRRIGDHVDLSFEMPPLAPGRVRTAFLSSNGYYVGDPPIQRQWAPTTVQIMREEPGALSRFSLDLAREYLRIAGTTPAAKMTAEVAP
jgi:hypothetical protein